MFGWWGDLGGVGGTGSRRFERIWILDMSYSHCMTRIPSKSLECCDPTVAYMRRKIALPSLTPREKVRPSLKVLQGKSVNFVRMVVPFANIKK